MLGQGPPLFDRVPTLIAGVDRRQLEGRTPSSHQVFVPLALDPRAILDNVLNLLPETRQVVVVLGDSSLERFWRGQLERDFAPYERRVTIRILNPPSIDQMRREIEALPKKSAILYGTLSVDRAGLPHEDDEGLAALHAAARVPLFSPFESQLGRGIVGGPLVSIEDEARRSAAVARKILGGEAIAAIAVAPPTAAKYLYDWRELRRFHIDLSRLPPGSGVRFRPPSLWEAYRKPAMIALGVVLVESLLLAALLAQHSRRRRAEARVHALNRRLMTAQEDERKLIARELHDDLSQRLARLSIDAARIEYAASVPVDGPRTSPMREELAQLSEDVHALAYQLHPTTLDDLGLADALRVECERFSRLESIPIAFDSGAALHEVSRETALCLFRVAQEALRNVARHARARTVSISCQPTGQGLRVVLSDDGVGFEPGRERRRPSLGLASMRERLELIGGSFDIESAPGRGTTVSAWAPLEPAPE